ASRAARSPWCSRPATCWPSWRSSQRINLWTRQRVQHRPGPAEWRARGGGMKQRKTIQKRRYEVLMAKSLEFDEDARRALERGVNRPPAAGQVTPGPQGPTVGIPQK